MAIADPPNSRGGHSLHPFGELGAAQEVQRRQRLAAGALDFERAAPRPSPQATVSSSSSSVPGSPAPSTTTERSTFRRSALPAIATSHQAPGKGDSARIWSCTSRRAGLPVDARLGLVDLAGVGHAFARLRNERQRAGLELAPAPRPSIARRPASAGRAVRRRSVALSIATRSASATGPVSSPASIFMIIMPVSRSPAMMARWIGAAPRQRGSSDAWPLKAPSRVPSRIAHRQQQAIGDDDGGIGSEVAEGLLLGLALQRDRRAHLDAQPFGLALHRRWRQLEPAPAGGPRRLRIDRSDVRGRPRQCARSVGTENSGVPMKIRRSVIWLGPLLPHQAAVLQARFKRVYRLRSSPSKSRTLRRAVPDPHHPARRRAILGELLELLHHHVALQLGDMVDEQHAVRDGRSRAAGRSPAGLRPRPPAACRCASRYFTRTFAGRSTSA